MTVPGRATTTGYPRHDLAACAAYTLVGPTAVGKTEVAHRMAVADGLDVLCADSMLVYRGMDVGTAKPSARELSEAVYRGLNLVEPDVAFSVGAYLEHAEEALRQAAAVGRIQILTGGTGLYVKGLLQGMQGSESIETAVRRDVERLAAAEGLPGLVNRLRSVAPERLDSLEDPLNPRRVQRALEYALAGVPAPEGWRQAPPAPVVGLCMERDDLVRRIDRRIDAMYAQGLLEETDGLLRSGDGLSKTAAGAIGYAEAARVLAGSIGVAEAKAATAARTRRLAKRQMTWFRGQLSVHWIRVEPGDAADGVAERVRRVWTEQGPADLPTARKRHA